MVSVESRSKVLGLITGREPEAIARTLAMMAYIPAIGRALARGGVKQFQDLMWKTIPKLYEAQADKGRFDALHAEACQRVISAFKTNHQYTLSYGQAQKPLNVFFKVYIDWAKQPSRELADKLAPFLHVPLDSLLMKFFSRELPVEYETHIAPLRRQRAERFAEGAKKLSETRFSRSVIESAIGLRFSLTAIDYETYMAWQRMFRALYPAKPVMLDIIWSVERLDLRENEVQSRQD